MESFLTQCLASGVCPGSENWSSCPLPDLLQSLAGQSFLWGEPFVFRPQVWKARKGKSGLAAGKEEVIVVAGPALLWRRIYRIHSPPFLHPRPVLH